MSARRQLAMLRATFRGWPLAVLRAFLWKHLRLPDRDLTLRTRRGTTIHAPLRHNIGSLYTAFEVFAFGAYGDGWDDLGRNPFVVDVGANLGAFTVWMAERHPDLAGVAFEPDPEAYDYLSRNVRANGLGAVETRPVAVGSRTGTARLHRTGYGDGTSSLIESSTVSDFTESVAVPTVGFDELIGDLDREIDVLKLDCEGAEYDIAFGSAADSWRRIARVTLEYHPVEGRSVAGLKSRFAELGFRVSGEQAFAPELGMLYLERGER